MKSNLTSIERTFFMVKPDGVKRGLVGEVFNRFERIGLKLVAARMAIPTEEQARGNYPGSEEWLTGMGQKTYKNYDGDNAAIMEDLGTIDQLEIGKKIYNGLVTYLTSGPVVMTVWEGNHAVRVAQKLIGKTDPTLADVGSMRGDFGFDTPQFAVKSGRVVFQNMTHISDSPEEAKREIKHWFGDKYKDLSEYERVDYVGMFDAYN